MYFPVVIPQTLWNLMLFKSQRKGHLSAWST